MLLEADDGVSPSPAVPKHTNTPQVGGRGCIDDCVPKTTCDPAFVCGTQPNGCGGQVACGDCGAGFKCEVSATGDSSSCKSTTPPPPAPCVPATTCPGGQKCGEALDAVCGERAGGGPRPASRPRAPCLPALLASRGWRPSCVLPCRRQVQLDLPLRVRAEPGYYTPCSHAGVTISCGSCPVGTACAPNGTACVKEEPQCVPYTSCPGGSQAPECGECGSRGEGARGWVGDGGLPRRRPAGSFPGICTRPACPAAPAGSRCASGPELVAACAAAPSRTCGLPT